MLNPQDIENKKFTVTRVRAGYVQSEVDDFLDDIQVAFRELKAERDLYRDRSEATIQLPPVPGVHPDISQASKILQLAEQSAASERAKAKQEADQLIQAARVAAQQIANDATSEREKIIADGTREKHALIGELEEKRERLNARVEALREAKRVLAEQLQTALAELGKEE
jgi:DivIVA domain-containing protein